MVSTWIDIQPYQYGLTITLISDKSTALPENAVAELKDCQLTMRKNITELGLVHEAFHVTCDVMKRKGIKLCDETEEAYAYLLEEITRKLLKKLNYLLGQYQLKYSPHQIQT